jgi:ATP-dependent DNA helicase RecG
MIFSFFCLKNRIFKTKIFIFGLVNKMQQDILNTAIEYLKGVGPKRGELLRKELNVHTFRDLLYQFPYRYVDKTRFQKVRELDEDMGDVQLKGILRRLSKVGEGRKRRLVGRFRDDSGYIDLVWFTGAHWLEKKLQGRR